MYVPVCGKKWLPVKEIERFLRGLACGVLPLEASTDVPPGWLVPAAVRGEILER
jgi:hypothetical protein